ncbi:MAG: hypothetical protein E7339_00430 [Clostridiales bacterium]|nr:hypothetical protein [Clostridiales bacterium]
MNKKLIIGIAVALVAVFAVIIIASSSDNAKNPSSSCTHTYVSNIVKDATCKEMGSKTNTCTICGFSYTESIPRTNSHLYNSVVTKEPTCRDLGIRTFVCKICNNSYEEYIEKTEEHNYESVVTKKATSSTSGIKTYTCTICGDVYTVEIPKLPNIVLGDSIISHVKAGGSIQAGCAIKIMSYILENDNKTINLNIYTGAYGYNEITTSFKFVLKIYNGEGLLLFSKQYATNQLSAWDEMYMDVKLTFTSPLTPGATYRFELA